MCTPFSGLHFTTLVSLQYVILVAEKLQTLPENSAEKLRQCGSLIGQLQYLIDATELGQTLLVSIVMPPQVR
jgi:hypothetical protein